MRNVFNTIDRSLARLTRRCPKCTGALHRNFSLLDKLGLFIPLPHTIYAKHHCEKCKSRFRSYRSLTDLFLEGSWLGAGLFLGEWHWLSLACPLTWLTCSRFAKNSWAAGADTIAAGTLTGILWLLALVFGRNHPAAPLLDHPLLFMALTAVFIFTPFWLVAWLDKHTTFGLKQATG